MVIYKETIIWYCRLILPLTPHLARKITIGTVIYCTLTCQYSKHANTQALQAILNHRFSTQPGLPSESFL